MSINLSSVNKSYHQAGRKIEVLKDLNMKLESGSNLAIVGDSGSGKSTLLSLLAGLDRPDSGSISISGQDLTQMSEEELTSFRGKNIGVVFQQYHLISHLQALENVLLPLDINSIERAEQKAVEALEQVGLKDRAYHLPHQLSGGECQRVALARAIVHRPEMILADEPSGNLDVETGNAVMNLMFDVISKHSLTMVLVTHNPELAKQCQNVYRLEKGKLELQ